MKDAADRRKELEKQHAEALSQLREKQAALEGVLGSSMDRKAYAETIEALQVNPKLKIINEKKWAGNRFQIPDYKHHVLKVRLVLIQVIEFNSWVRTKN